MDNVEWIKNGCLFIGDGPEFSRNDLVFVTTDDVGFKCYYVAQMKINEHMNSVQAAADDICDQVGRSLAFWAETDEDKAELKQIIYDKALLIKDRVDMRPFA